MNYQIEKPMTLFQKLEILAERQNMMWHVHPAV